MPSTNLPAKRSNRKKPVRCPECNAELTVKLDNRQQRLIKELVSGKHDTQKSAAEAVNFHPESVVKLMASAGFNVQLAKAKHRALDKARAVDERAERLLTRGIEALEDAMRGGQVNPELAGSVVRLMIDVQEKRAKRRELLGERDGTEAEKAAREFFLQLVNYGIRLGRRTDCDVGRLVERVERKATRSN